MASSTAGLHSKQENGSRSGGTSHAGTFWDRICIPKDAQTSLAICVLLGSISVAMSMLNKFLLSSYNFSCYFLMISVQLLITAGFCIGSRDFFGNPFSIQQFDKAILKASLPMSGAYVANVSLGLLGLQLTAVPVFYAIRRTAAAFVLLYEFVHLRKVSSRQIYSAVGMIGVGALLTAADSFSNSTGMAGILVTVLNNVATAVMGVSQKQFSDSTGIGGIRGPWTLMYYQSLTALPVCLLLAVFTGELQQLAAFPYLADPRFLAGLLLVSGMGLLLSYASMLSTTYNSPLATNITGNAKDIVVTAAGAVLFPGFKASASSVSGLVLSFGGSAYYSYVKLQEAMQAKQGGGGGGGAATARGNSASSGSGSGSSNSGRAIELAEHRAELGRAASMEDQQRAEMDEEKAVLLASSSASTSEGLSNR